MLIYKYLQKNEKKGYIAFMSKPIKGLLRTLATATTL